MAEKENLEQEEILKEKENDNIDPVADGHTHNMEEKELQDQGVNPSDDSKLTAENKELKEKYLRLYSEFENYRRRTAKERLDLIKTASEDVIVEMLPVLDDFERALKAESAGINESSNEGIRLIYQKLLKSLGSKGLKPMEELTGASFDADLHEAITQIPAPSEELKGKIVDVVEKGYFLGEKVVRYAKVVIGQ